MALGIATLVCCRSTDPTSEVKLVGGEPAPDPALPSVFIWTSEDSNLRESFCTGTKVAADLILTAAHCVLKQEPRESGGFLGPWRRLDAVQPGKWLTLSFERALTDDASGDDRLAVAEVLLPPLAEACLAGTVYDANLCEYRAPLPDVALIRVLSPSGRFAETPAARVNYDWVSPETALTLCGYGAEAKNSELLPRLKHAPATVASDAAFLAALAGTEADHDGRPDMGYFFGVVSPMDAQNHVNLGSGDSGGPVFARGGAVVGVNSDGFCPAVERDCQVASNSMFTRLSDERPAAVGAWLRKFLDP